MKKKDVATDFTVNNAKEEADGDDNDNDDIEWKEAWEDKGTRAQEDFWLNERMNEHSKSLARYLNAQINKAHHPERNART